MIGAAYVRKMARYNAWQNAGVYGAAAGLSDAERRQERGAFFGSIHGTLAHLLWGDMMWMSRFDGGPVPDAPLGESAGWVADWDALCDRRHETDAHIRAWAGRVTDAALTGDLDMFSAALGRRAVKAMDLCVVHFFNHQTHHRGQVHAMLTAAGAVPGVTDLFIMPDEG